VAVARLFGELRRRSDWLLVFDNAEDPATLAGFLPAGPGRVVITSRNPGWSELATVIEVAVFTRGESIELLRRSAAELTDEEADRVADAVGDLPLVVEQAGALLGVSDLSADEYLGLVAERTEQLFDHDPHRRYPRSVTASWAVAFDRAAAEDPTSLDLLTLIAWLGPEPVPVSLLFDDPGRLPTGLDDLARDPLARAGCLSALSRRGLATISRHTVRLHRVPAALLRARSRGAGNWQDRALELLWATVPEEVWNNPSSWPVWQQLLPHVLSATDARRWPEPPPADGPSGEQLPWLLGRAAAFLQSRGEPRSARSLFQRSLVLYRRLGADHAGTLAAATNLAENLRVLGDHRRARELDEETLIRRRRGLGHDHPDTLASANALALDLHDLGEHRLARDLGSDTLGRRRRVLGEDHIDTLISASNFARDLYAFGEYEAARELNEDTLVRRRRTLGDDHPNTLTSASNLAAALSALGRHQEARRLDEDTLARRQRVQGVDHPDALMSASNLADDLRALGEFRAAHRLDEQCLAAFRRVLGDDHPSTRVSAGNLARDLLELGDHRQAQRWLAWAHGHRGSA
jgi:hypothetical protein